MTALLCALFALKLLGGAAERFELRGSSRLEGKSLHTLHAFYVYAAQDSPEKASTPATIDFEGLHADLAEHGRHSMPYRGVQMVLMPYQHFWNLINPQKFCCDAVAVDEGYCDVEDQLLLRGNEGLQRLEPSRRQVNDLVRQEWESNRSMPLWSRRLGGEWHGAKAGVEEGRSKDDGEDPVVVTTVPTDSRRSPSQQGEIILPQTGVYILAVSNCGEEPVEGISGSITVLNPYGYLPGIHYHLMSLFSTLTMVYAAIACFWCAWLMSWRAQLFRIQKAIFVVLILAVAEAALNCADMATWNRTGERSWLLYGCAAVLSILEDFSTYALLLTASLGWGVMRPTLGKQLERRIAALFFFYASVRVLEAVGLTSMHTGIIHCFLYAFMVGWIGKSLLGMSRILRETQRFDQLLFFQRLRCVLALGLLIAAAVLVLRISRYTHSMTVRWKGEWLLDAGDHALLLAVHIASVYLWAPNRYVQGEQMRQNVERLLPGAALEKEKDEELGGEQQELIELPAQADIAAGAAVEASAGRPVESQEECRPMMQEEAVEESLPGQAVESSEQVPLPGAGEMSSLEEAQADVAPAEASPDECSPAETGADAREPAEEAPVPPEASCNEGEAEPASEQVHAEAEIHEEEEEEVFTADPPETSSVEEEASPPSSAAEASDAAGSKDRAEEDTAQEEETAQGEETDQGEDTARLPSGPEIMRNLYTFGQFAKPFPS